MNLRAAPGGLPWRRWADSSPPCPGQGQSAQTPKGEEREPQPATLAPPRLASERPEHHPVSFGDLITACQEVAEPLLLVGRHPSRSLLDLLLEDSQPLKLGLVAPDRLAALPVGLALPGGEEGELDPRHRLFEPIEPVMIHMWEGEKQKAGEPQQDRGNDSNPC